MVVYVDIIWCTGKINNWLRKDVHFFNGLLKVSCPLVFIPIWHYALLAVMYIVFSSALSSPALFTFTFYSCGIWLLLQFSWVMNQLSGDKCISCYVEVMSFSDYSICNRNQQVFFSRNLPVYKGWRQASLL